MNKLTWTDFFILTTIASFFDVLNLLLGFIPYVGWILCTILGATASVVFFTYSKIRKINLNKKILTSSIIEWIPIVNILPAWTAMIVVAYAQQQYGGALSKMNFLNQSNKNIRTSPQTT